MQPTVLSYKIHTVVPYINWIYFFHAWGFQPRFAAIANIHGSARQGLRSKDNLQAL